MNRKSQTFANKLGATWKILAEAVFLYVPILDSSVFSLHKKTLRPHFAPYPSYL